MKLRVSENQRFILREDGLPFFYLGDTAWELFHRLDRDEATHYLRTRAQQRFTVIQAVVLAELDGLRVPNSYGAVPFHDLDPARPNEDYFRHVDWILERAASLGLTIGLLPTWGDKFNCKWGQGPEIFTPANAEAYGEHIGRRYRDYPLIWILGGDRQMEQPQHFAIVRAMARGLRNGDGGRHLMTLHPMGGHSSSGCFHEDSWLDFNMLQSGHGERNTPNWNMITADFKRQPAKPCLDGEANYEDHPINWKPENGWFDAHDVRQTAYRSLLAGACGYTYGCHDIWQFWQPSRKPISAARTPWRAALELPGAWQMQHVRAFFEKPEWLRLSPDQAVVLSETGVGGEHIRAARASDNAFAWVYLPQGGEVRINVAQLGACMTAAWYDPRTGATRSGDTVSGTPTLRAPTADDWLLSLRNCAKEGA